MADDGEDDDLYGDLPLGNAATNARADEVRERLMRTSVLAAHCEAGQTGSTVRRPPSKQLTPLSVVLPLLAAARG